MQAHKQLQTYTSVLMHSQNDIPKLIQQCNLFFINGCKWRRYYYVISVPNNFVILWTGYIFMQKDKAVLIYIVVHCQNKEIIFVSCFFFYFLNHVFKKTKNTSEYSVNSLFFSRKILILSAKYCQIRYLRVRISGNRHFTCSIQKKFKILFFFGGHFVISS